jgi:hypothetical protein
MFWCNVQSQAQGKVVTTQWVKTWNKGQVVLRLKSFPRTTFYVATLALGSRPRQGVARLRAKKETRESHHMLLGVQTVWGNEPSHSQMNSHSGSWSPKWTPESSKRDCRGQNSMAWDVFYTIGKVLKRKCQKWARITHLDIWKLW